MATKITIPEINELCEFAGISIPYIYVAQRTLKQTADAIRQGPEGQRADQQGSIKFKLSDFTGGLFKRVGDWTRDGNRYAYNEGLMTHQGGLYQPYVLTTQANITSDADISGFRAANKRVRALNSALGTSALRYYLAVGTKLYTDTSSSNPALAVLKTLTNNIHSMAISKINSNTTYLFLGTDGTTDDVLGIADPIDAPGTTVTIIALSGGDIVEAIGHFPTVGNGYTLYYGKIAGVSGLFYTSFADGLPATATQVVNSATYSSQNSSAATVTVTKSVTQARTDTSVGNTAWATISNLFSSDNNYATFDFSVTGGDTTNRLLVGGCDWTSIPLSAEIVGVQVLVERKQASSGSPDVRDEEIRLYVAGSPVGYDKADIATTWPTTDTVKTYGATNDLWARNWEVSDLRTLEVAIRTKDYATGGGNPDGSIDLVQIAVTYRLPGTGITLPIGGWSSGPLPSNPNRWPLVLPTIDEQSTVLTPRELWFADVSFDTSGNRPIVTLSKVYTGLSHVEALTPFSGGLAVAGDTSSGVGKQIKLVDASGNVRDLGFLGQDGFESAVGAVNMFSAGRILIVEVAWESAAEAQWWYYFDGTWHASTPLQSKSNAIAALPLAWAESAININQQMRYRIFPNSTRTAAARSFQPRNMFEDPLVNNTSQVKQDGPLFIRSPELNLAGPEEARKSLLYIDYLGRLASATGGSYGTVLVELDLGGDTAFGTAEVSNTFDSAFESYAVPSSGSAFQTAIIRITLDHAAGSSKTANGVPLLFTSVVEWPLLREWNVYLHRDTVAGKHDDITNLYTQIEAQATSKVTQRFRLGDVDVPAVFEGMDVTLLPVPVGSPGVAISGAPFMTFREVRGTAT